MLKLPGASKKPEAGPVVKYNISDICTDINIVDKYEDYIKKTIGSNVVIPLTRFVEIFVKKKIVNK